MLITSSETPTLGPLISVDGILIIFGNPVIKIASLVGVENISRVFGSKFDEERFCFNKFSNCFLALICKLDGISSLNNSINSSDIYFSI